MAFNIANIMAEINRRMVEASRLAIENIKKAQELQLRQIPNIATLIRNGKDKSDIRCNLASAYGNLTKESFKKMDRQMQVVIGYTVGCLNKLGIFMNWDTVVRCMNQNRLLTVKPGSALHRTDGVSKSGTGVFKTDGSPSSAIVREIHAWFIRLVSDSDVLRDTGIDINLMGRMVAESGASVSDFGSVFYKKVNKSRECMDISILRFPDLDRPYFKVYRIRLRAWRKCERILFVQKDKSGINGEYNSVCYIPVPSAIANVKQEVADQAVKEAEELFA